MDPTVALVLLAGLTLFYEIFRKKNGGIGENNNKKIDKNLIGLYQTALRKELGRIGIVGPGFETVTTSIKDTFTSLRISESSGTGFAGPGPHGQLAAHCETGELDGPAVGRHGGEPYLSPEQVIKRAFQKYRLLLIVGDPGSGKTTLLKYYAVTCLDKNQENLGFESKKIIPLFFPLRELLFDKDGKAPLSLHENLAAWAKKNYLDITADEFSTWMKNRPTLVLLDGLDEIGDTEKRIQVCDWVKNAWTGLHQAFFILTSRYTGIRKSDGIELQCEHMRGEIMNFTAEQQAIFLKRWFTAVAYKDLSSDAGKQEKETAGKVALGLAAAMTTYLDKKENKSVRELARVPMLLQIMAIIWKRREFLPVNRLELYDISLDYLLDHRDRLKKLEPLLPAGIARLILAPTALWMQETLRSDNAPAEEIYKYMQPILDTLDNPPRSVEFCRNLCDRAGLFADYAKGSFIFRHKSFMEYLAGIQEVSECHKNKRRINRVAGYFPDPWWEETLLFFAGKADDVIFNRLMAAFFDSPFSLELNPATQTLLQNFIQEVPQKRVDVLVKKLHSGSGQVNANRERYILDCLKTIGTPAAIAAVENFSRAGKGNKSNLEYARDITAEFSSSFAGPQKKIVRVMKPGQVKETPGSFRNPFEDNVEYILIPGGTYTFSVSGSKENVPPLYLCKYLVTNKRYRHFISYLGGSVKEFEKLLPVKLFTGKLLDFAGNMKRYKDYLEERKGDWPYKLRSRYDEEKRFKGDDQPVVGVSWYDARSYCFWLSCLEAAAGGDEKLQDMDKISRLFRLPTEIEWEWAAAGREKDGSLRPYPWPGSKGDPSTGLANYDGNVGSTTPVGRYPEGATPEGLLDMAGNAWEWMENHYSKNMPYPALRGGSWYNLDTSLSCAARVYVSPESRNYFIGFRVLRAE